MQFAMTYWPYIAGGTFLLITLLLGIRIVPQTRRGLIARFGGYNRYALPGLHIIIPFVESMRLVDITEDMVSCEPQNIITKDNLNARVDLVVYYQVQDTEDSVKRSQYNVADYERQIISLARTTARNVVGQLSFTETNSEREKLNQNLETHLSKEAANWGIRIVRVELKEIDPPDEVQKAMNQVVTAQQEKVAAIDFATAEETKADGARRAAIKEAEGGAEATRLNAKAQADAVLLKAEAEAKAIEVVNKAAQTHFKDNAITLKQLQTMAECTKDNSKIIILGGGESSLRSVLAAAAGIQDMLGAKPAEDKKETAAAKAA